MDIVTFITVVGILLLPEVYPAYQKRHTCDGDLTLSCTEGEIVLVAINTADRYDLTACPDPAGRYTQPNPKMKKLVWELCNGREKCTVKTGIRMEDYRYVDVVYDCGMSFDLCSKDVILANSSYLRSPNEFIFTSKQKCECEAKMGEPAELTVRVVEKEFNVTMPKLTITWQNKTQDIAKVLRETAQSFKISFNANHEAGSGSFLIHYKADREVKLECNQQAHQKVALSTILIAPIAMVGLLVLVAILFLVIKKSRGRKGRVITSPGTEANVESASAGHYGSTVGGTEETPNETKQEVKGAMLESL